MSEALRGKSDLDARRWMIAERIYARYVIHFESSAPPWSALALDQREAWLDVVAPWADSTLDAFAFAEVLADIEDALGRLPTHGALSAEQNEGAVKAAYQMAVGVLLTKRPGMVNEARF